MYDPKTKAQHCDVCGREMNPTDWLTQLWKPGAGEPMGVCPSIGCWKAANALGYLSRAQQARQQG